MCIKHTTAVGHRLLLPNIEMRPGSLKTPGQITRQVKLNAPRRDQTLQLLQAIHITLEEEATPNYNNLNEVLRYIYAVE